MNTQNRVNFLINALYFSLLAVLSFLAVKYLLKWFLPFILAFLIATAAYRVTEKLSKHGKINEKVSATVLVIFIYAILGCFLIILTSSTILAADKFADRISGLYTNTLVPIFNTVTGWIDNILSHISPDIRHISDMTLEEFYNNFENVISMLSERIIRFAGNLVKNVPSIVAGFLITIVSSIMLSLNYRATMKFLRENLPEKVTAVVTRVKNFVTTSVFKMLKAYITIMGITFLELFLGFLILGIEKPLLLAFVVSLIDILPILGVGIVLIPWIVISLFQKNFFLAIGLGILYLVITVLRNVIEPKVVGKQIGLSPLVSLIAVYVGFRALGVFGMFIFPISLIVIRDLIKNKTIKF